MILLQFEGIKGNATAKGYKDHLQAESFQFGVGRGISMEPGNLANRESTRPSLSEVVISHKCDSSATELFNQSVAGFKGKKVTIKFVQTGGEKLEEFMQYILTDVLISGYSISADGDSAPMETISMSYSKIEVKYVGRDKANAGSGPNVVGYDLEKGGRA